MIQLEEIHIEKFRGICNLTLELNRKSFAIQGPNGSGKSGVVDSIEFGLTGSVKRLMGRGTGGLTVKKHGPHVDARETPESAFVRLKVYIPKLKKSATITRTVKTPSKPIIEQDGKAKPDADVLAAIEDAAAHPEIALTRRQIVRFILTEAKSRSEEVQNLLRLDELEKNRAVFKKADNTAARQLKENQSASANAAAELCRHLNLEKLSADLLLKAVNEARAKLGLDAIGELDRNTSIKDGLKEATSDKSSVVKKTAQADLDSLSKSSENPTLTESLSIIEEHFQILDADPELQVALRRQQLVDSGLNLLDADECPLCDKEWDEEKLRNHLLAKLEQSKKAATIAATILENGTTFATAARAHVSSIRLLQSTAERLKLPDVATALASWIAQLESFADLLRSIDGISSSREKLKTWHQPSSSAKDALTSLAEAIEKLPNESSATDRDFLVEADIRLESWRKCKRAQGTAASTAELAHVAYEMFCVATETVLESLYSQVEKAFTDSYRDINGDDEGEFTAKLTPGDGKLDLDVDFHKRGLFHPGAYHSEGHQDGMGLCLYLALMKQLFGDDFRLVILDDVVMSVDRHHRKELCRVLKEAFPDTQFVITTHEKAWFHQMISAKLITKKSGVTFRGWSVDTGPLVNEATDVWDDIDAAMKADDVPTAAARLRRYMEFISAELAEAFGSSVQFRSDGDHDMGEILPNVISRFRSLLGNAASAAQAWKDDDAAAKVKELKNRLGLSVAGKDIEQWAVNKAVHYNSWADFVKQDFKPIVTAYKSLLECFQCPSCKTWLYATPPKGSVEAIRCDCNKTNFNLKEP